MTVVNAAVKDDSTRATVLSLFSGLCQLAMVAGSSVIGVVLAHYGGGSVGAATGIAVGCWLCTVTLAMVGMAWLAHLMKGGTRVSKAKRA